MRTIACQLAHHRFLRQRKESKVPRGHRTSSTADFLNTFGGVVDVDVVVRAITTAGMDLHRLALVRLACSRGTLLLEPNPSRKPFAVFNHRTSTVSQPCGYCSFLVHAEMKNTDTFGLILYRNRCN